MPINTQEEHCQAVTIFSMFCAEQSSITATQTSVKSTADWPHLFIYIVHLPICVDTRIRAIYVLYMCRVNSLSSLLNGHSVCILCLVSQLIWNWVKIIYLDNLNSYYIRNILHAFITYSNKAITTLSLWVSSKNHPFQKYYKALKFTSLYHDQNDKFLCWEK